VDFVYATRMSTATDPLHDEALARLQVELPSPYAEVIQYVPHPVATPTSSPGNQNATSAGTQVELEDWRWGNIPPALRSEVDTWVRGYAAMASSALADVPELKAQDVEGYHVEPLPIVQGFIAALMADPSGYLEKAFGRPMSP